MSLRMFMPFAALILATCVDSPVDVPNREVKVGRNHAWNPFSLPQSTVSELRLSPDGRQLVSGRPGASWHASYEPEVLTRLTATPTGVNNEGVMVGYSAPNAVYWPSPSATPIVLPALPGASYSMAWDLGPGTEPIIVGQSGGVPVRWDFVGGAPVVSELPNLGTGSARAINVTAGMIGGESADAVAHWTLAGNLLSTYPVPGAVLDINAAGQMVGSGAFNDWMALNYGFILDKGRFATIGWDFGYGKFHYDFMNAATLLAINDAGVAVGYVVDDENTYRFLPVQMQFGGPPRVDNQIGFNRQYAAVGATTGVVTVFNYHSGYPSLIEWNPAARLVPDVDADGFEDADDNCPRQVNDQQDADGDGFGDVCDVVPIIRAPATVFEETDVVFRGGNYSEPLSPISYNWTFADGHTASRRVVTHRFTSRGSHLVTLEGHYRNGASGTTTLTINVVNAPPVVSIAAAHSTLVAGTQQTLSISISDASPGESVSWAVDWGTTPRSRGVCSGPANCQIEVSRTIPVAGTYRARIIATDSEGARRTADVTFVVTD